MGFLDRLLGERNARAVQQVYDRTADAANRGIGAVSQGLDEIDAYRSANKQKLADGTSTYDGIKQGLGQFVDSMKQVPNNIENYRQANLDKQGREDPLQGIRRFFS